MEWSKIKDDGKTAVWQEKDYQFNAPHRFQVTTQPYGVEDIVLEDIHFQEGPIQEHGVNGVTNEDLIHIVMARLEGFQKSEFSCRENALALTKLEEALMWLNRRTQKRIERGVEGTNVR
jgi:hypothetical protein